MNFWKRSEKRERVRVFDPDTKVVTMIPASELAPGMVRTRMSGQEGEFWVDASKLKPGAYRHPPFSEEVRGILGNIEETLREVYPLTLEQWEDGFRRDANAEREIAFWLHLSQVYSQTVGERPFSLKYKQDIFRVLVSCLNNPKDKVLTVVALQVMSRQEAEDVMGAFYGQ